MRGTGTVVVHEKTVEAARPFLDTQVDAAAPAYDFSLISLDELRLIEAFFQRRDSLDPALAAPWPHKSPIGSQ